MQNLVRIPERVLFTAGRAATAWDQSGRPIAWSEWSEDDLRKLVENDHHLRATGQPQPYINPAHFTEPVPGFVGPLRFIPSSGGKPARVAAEVHADEWIARQVLAGRRPWRSVEVTRDATAADFHGIRGPVLRGLALLNTHPRRKNLDSPVYAERGITCFEEPGAVSGSVYVTPFQETLPMDIAKIMAALEALDGDSEKLAAVAKALGLSGDAPAAPDAPPAVAADPVDAPPKDEEETLVPMSEVAALKAQLAKAQQQADHASKRASDAVKLGEDALTRERNRQLDVFHERLVKGYGKARADAARLELQEDLARIPVAEVYADPVDGQPPLQHTERLFARKLATMGEPTVQMMSDPMGAGRPPAKVETYADAARAIVEEAKAEPGQPAMSVLRNPAFSHVLDRMAKRRMQEVS